MSERLGTPDEAPRRGGITRRRLLVAGAGALGAAALGDGGRLLINTLGTSAVAPSGAGSGAAAPSFHSRPDLRLAGLTVSRSTAATTPGLIFLAPYNGPTGGQAGALIVDERGESLFQQPLNGLVTTDFRVQRYRGRPVLTWWDGTIELGHGVGAYVIADHSYEPIAHVQAGNGRRGDLHEFLLTERGTALLTTYALAERDLSAVGGSRSGSIQDAMFQEIDLASGRVLLEWHSLDHVGIEESYWPVSTDWDYFHINSVEVDTDGNLLISARNTHAIYKVHRTSGAIIWRLGGKRSDLSIGRGAAFAWQHDARRQRDGSITVFDNEGSPDGGQTSRAIVLTVDETHRTVALRRSFTHPSRLLSSSQGNMQVLENGNVFVSWGAQPYVSEFDPSGELLFDAQLGAGCISYRAYRTAWLATAPGSPRIATERLRYDRTMVWVSWNGDSRVRHWTLLAGDSPQSLAPVGSVPRSGFETAMLLRARPRHVAVRGADAGGRTLGRSVAVAT